jgi:tRNA pseudouridine38-40 synthase
VAYDGAAYAGWQAQPAVPTVQGTLLTAARALLGGSARLIGASRTDAGVHALRQVASLTTDSTRDVVTIGRALNAALPADIRVADVREEAPGFDARRCAVGKRYLYLIDTATVAGPMSRRYAWHVPRPLDLGATREALAAVRGDHDFSAFCAAAGRGAMPRCHVRAVHLVCRKSLMAVVLSADRFLHHMVRNLVGSVIAVGHGAHDPGWMTEVLASRDRRRAGATAPAHGLFLLRVLY